MSRYWCFRPWFYFSNGTRDYDRLNLCWIYWYFSLIKTVTIISEISIVKISHFKLRLILYEVNKVHTYIFISFSMSWIRTLRSEHSCLREANSAVTTKYYNTVIYVCFTMDKAMQWILQSTNKSNLKCWNI